MSLFVCGLLRHKNMSFLSLTQNNDKYAKSFLSYLKLSASRNYKIEVEKHTQSVDNISDDYTRVGVSPECFICARDKDPRNMSYDNLLVLDAFSREDQFTRYHPLVWHICCLWLFDRDAPEKKLCSYAVKSYGDKGQSYIFIANYEDHVANTRLKDKIQDKDVVAALVTQPLELYRTHVLTLSIAPAAVLSKIRHARNIDAYRPLAYAHLLVQPACPLYADVDFNTDLEALFAAVVGLPQNDIIDNLVLAKLTNDLIQRSDALKASPTSYQQLANAHYDLMMTHKFVIVTPRI